MTTPTELRCSFDNILKELDDICKGIDNITEHFPGNEEYNEREQTGPVHTQLQRNHITNININNVSFIEHSNDDYEPINLEHKQETSNFNLYNKNENVQSQLSSNNGENLNSEIFLSFEKNLSNGYNESLEINDERIIIEEPIENGSLKEDTKSTSSLKNKFKKHILPDEESSSLNSAIGSVQDSLLKLNMFPLETTSSVDVNKNNSNFNKVNNEELSEGIKFLTTEFNGYEKLTRNENLGSRLLHHGHTQVSFQINDGSDNEQSSSSNQLCPDEPYEKLQNLSSNRIDLIDNEESGDYLSSQEISKIKCFYSSMGCYVHVNHSTAELYQIKREDAFDELDNDPVNDYKLYMEKLEIEKNKNNAGENDDLESSTNKPNVNYMYINSGVPVIVFNYGSNPKREKDLRILLVERSTGFCMWQFKFDWLTLFENQNNITVVRLAFSNKIVNNIATDSTGILSTLSSKLNSTSNQTNYQNEYFEKFFSCKNRHAHKEHLLKFVDKYDCDEFCSRQRTIMTRNPEQFTFEQDEQNYANLNLREVNLTNNELLPAPPPPIKISSSVIMCHFDYYNSKENAMSKIEEEISKPPSSQSLSDLTTQNEKILGNKFVEESKISTMRTNLLGKYSISSANLLSPDNSLGALIKRKLFGSNMSMEEFKKETNTTTSITKKSEINLKPLKFKFKKLRKSDISAPANFNHVTHLDKPVPIGRRYKLNYKS